eukprot:230859-Pyramimonas_sp.AAC.3
MLQGTELSNEEGAVREDPGEMSPSDERCTEMAPSDEDRWCTPGWKWAPGPRGPSELVVYGLGSPTISSASRDQVCGVRVVIE